MKIKRLKAVKLGNIVITTSNSLSEIILEMEAKEVAELFFRAINEKKITFGKKQEEQR